MKPGKRAKPKGGRPAAAGGGGRERAARVECFDAIHAHWRRLNVLAGMLELCDELQGGVLVEAGMVGELGGLFSRELKGMRARLRRLAEICAE